VPSFGPGEDRSGLLAVTNSPVGNPRIRVDAVWRVLAPWADRFLDLLFPSHCAGCGRPGPAWCNSCQGKLQLLEGRLCPTCGLPLHGRDRCRATLDFPVRSYARYRGPLVRALLHLKYRPNDRLAAVMGEWLASIARREGWHPTLIVHVPVAPERRRRRGYNQAALIAAHLAASLDLPSNEAALTRISETRSQVGLDGAARQQNVAGAFQADARVLRESVVCLVDDLCTTGATLMACGRACVEADARAVYGLTVGRAG
jgi:ComF family protein